MRRFVMNRRTFLRRVGMTGVALAGTGGETLAPRQVRTTNASPAATPPNILVIMVDQLRYPQWFPKQAQLDAALPALARLRQGAVSFGQHYTAANACTPARACLLTGLYSHQTACLLTNVSDLDTGFPTWGTLLRGLSYQTYWYGKWHLSASCDLDPYGFSGGTCPSPNGAPGQGLAKDPDIAAQFQDWFAAHAAAGPWCTTISLVNPHDIAWYPRWTDNVQGESNPPRVFTELPPNYETPRELIARNKPRLQRAFQQVEAEAFGYLPFNGPNFEAGWLELLDLYLLLQHYVDTQIGVVLDTLEANAAVAANTIIVFTADHGEYGGSHGLRGKGGAAYDEAIRVPLYVRDPTGQYTTSPDVERSQLTSSVDLTPLLLTLASGNGWRTQPQYAHLADRLDMTAILRDPVAAGRPYILHTTDEAAIEEAPATPYAADAPAHVIGYRTAAGKLGTYSNWTDGTIAIEAEGQESECYDYSSTEGRQELANVAGANNLLYRQLYTELTNDAIPNELRKPLPDYLQAAQQAALLAYLNDLKAAQPPQVFLPFTSR